MAINFPEFPPNGFQYTYQSRTYTWYQPNPNTDDLGYWRIIEPGTLGPADATTINNDSYTEAERDILNIEGPYTDDEYVTPEALGQSVYMTDFGVGTAPAPGGNPDSKSIRKDSQLNLLTDKVMSGSKLVVGRPGYGTNDQALKDGPAGGINITSGAIYEDSNGRGALDVNFSLPYASTSRNGIVGISNTDTFTGNTFINPDRTDLVPSMKNLGDVFQVAYDSSRLELGFEGREGRSKHYIRGTSSSGLMLQWGSEDVGYSFGDWIEFEQPFAIRPFFIVIQHRQDTGGVVIADISLYSNSYADKFSWRGTGCTPGSFIDYLAIGQCTGQSKAYPG